MVGALLRRRPAAPVPCHGVVASGSNVEPDDALHLVPERSPERLKLLGVQALALLDPAPRHNAVGGVGRELAEHLADVQWARLAPPFPPLLDPRGPDELREYVWWARLAGKGRSVEGADVHDLPPRAGLAHLGEVARRVIGVADGEDPARLVGHQGLGCV